MNSGRKVSRRAVLEAGGLTLASLYLSSCERAIDEIEERTGGGLPDSLLVADSVPVDGHFHFLNRISFGPAPGDLEAIKACGKERWLRQQLNYVAIDEGPSRLRTRRFESRFLREGDLFDFRKEVLREDLVRHTLLKAIYSKRQLFEVMVSFWSDHLNINIEKGNCVYYKTVDDINVVRSHALGNFRDLIGKSAKSAAMLEYLDGKDNKKTTAQDQPNENYARELLELHTLGVDGGYSQEDVLEAARCLTGWRVKEGFGRGAVYFDPARHDDGQKLVLGTVVPAGGGMADIDRLVDIVISHPSTARHIAGKLVRHFVMDEPFDQAALRLRDNLATRFSASGGDIKSMVEELFLSDVLSEHRGNKFKRPFHFLVSSLRALGGKTLAAKSGERGQGILDYLSAMGQEPFQHPTPDGYPEERLPWLGTLLWRWNFAFALAHDQVASVKVERDRLFAAIGGDGGNKDIDDEDFNRHLFAYFVGRLPQTHELKAFRQIENAGSDKGNLLGLVLASPAFQRF